MTNKDFFYCYNKDLFKYIHNNKGIDYKTIAINPTTKKTFSMFAKTDQLQTALNEFNSKNEV